MILDSSGFSKGYGFVRFGSEDEQKDSLTTMNGYIGLGTKALKICNAVPKPKGALTSPSTTSSTSTTATYTTATTDYSQYYDPSAYWQNYTSWQTVGVSNEISNISFFYILFIPLRVSNVYFYVDIYYVFTLSLTFLALVAGWFNTNSNSNTV